MKLLFDFLPIILFFGTFKAAEGRKEWAAQFASDHLSENPHTGHDGLA